MFAPDKFEGQTGFVLPPRSKSGNKTRPRPGTMTALQHLLEEAVPSRINCTVRGFDWLSRAARSLAAGCAKRACALVGCSKLLDCIVGTRIYASERAGCRAKIDAVACSFVAMDFEDRMKLNFVVVEYS